jgi:hypothetical protein
MKLGNIRTLTEILLLAQLRARMQGSARHWYRRPKGLEAISAGVFVISFALVLSFVNAIQFPPDILSQIDPFLIQVFSLLPIALLFFALFYSILFVIGESSQFATTEIVNYMPISSTEYVLASAFSTFIMYSFLLTAILGVTLALAISFGLLELWAVSSLFSIFFMMVGGFTGEIIRALVNRVSSSFSKRSGRSAIISRAVAIIVVLALTQVFFNFNILYKILQVFAPQIQSLWFIPVLWPSVVLVSLYAGNLLQVFIFSCITVAFGLALLGLGIYLRSRYWVPLPVTVRMGTSKPGSYRGPGLLGRIGFSQAEAALIRKDSRSLFRRKEMVRYLALPIIIFIPILVSTSSGTGGGLGTELSIGGLSILGSGMFGLFVSITSFGQEGQAIWNIYASPVNAKSLYRAKLAFPLMISMLPAVVLPSVVSLIYGFRPFLIGALIIMAILLTTLAVLVGALLGPKYMDLEEKPRTSFATGTGITLGFVIIAGLGLICVSPILLYFLNQMFPIVSGFSSILALAMTVSITLAFIGLLYVLAGSSVKEIAKELPLQ